MCTDAFDLKGGLWWRWQEDLLFMAGFAIGTIIIHPQIFMIASLWASCLPTRLSLSCRWDNAHRLFRVCWWPVLIGEAWHHGAGGKGFAFSCNTLTHPGGHGGCHETFISSENCTYVEVIKTCFIGVAILTLYSGARTCTNDVSLLTGSLTHRNGITPNFSNTKIIFNNLLRKL